MPIVLQDLFGLYGLGIDKQSAGVAVKAVYHVGCAFLPTFAKIVVKDGFDTELMMVGSHGKNADVLLDDADMVVFIYQFNEAAYKGRSVFAFGDFHCHSRLKKKVVLSDNLAVYPDATAGEDGFCLGTADAIKTTDNERQEFRGFFNLEYRVLWGVGIIHS